MATKISKPETLTTTLRRAIARSPKSYKALERETGVLRQSLMRFVHKEQTLRLDIADKLAEYFGLELVQRKVK